VTLATAWLVDPGAFVVDCTKAIATTRVIRLAAATQVRSRRAAFTKVFMVISFRVLCGLIGLFGPASAGQIAFLGVVL
jgi:hypothetical protein